MKKEFKTNDPEVLCEKLNIVVEYSNYSTKGYCYRISNQRFIVISKSLCDENKSYVLAHELGHVILHHSNSIYAIYHSKDTSKKVYEYEANLFANALLS